MDVNLMGKHKMTKRTTRHFQKQTPTNKLTIQVYTPVANDATQNALWWHKILKSALWMEMDVNFVRINITKTCSFGCG